VIFHSVKKAWIDGGLGLNLIALMQSVEAQFPEQGSVDKKVRAWGIPPLG
jgi:hypothetical protein